MFYFGPATCVYNMLYKVKRMHINSIEQTCECHRQQTHTYHIEIIK